MIVENIIEKLAQGGPLMIPIASVSVVAWALIVERFLWLRRQGQPTQIADDLDVAIRGGDLRRASVICEAGRGMVARAVAGLLGGGALSPGAVEDRLREVVLREFAVSRRTLPAIGILASIAPLLGLLGTVTGMIETFDAI
ncbi:MAG: MotA/TolQ/ExbB proton channel family protein, partial [Planctomycetota bacterium]